MLTRHFVKHISDIALLTHALLILSYFNNTHIMQSTARIAPLSRGPHRIRSGDPPNSSTNNAETLVITRVNRVQTANSRAESTLGRVEV